MKKFYTVSHSTNNSNNFQRKDCPKQSTIESILNFARCYEVKNSVQIDKFEFLKN